MRLLTSQIQELFQGTLWMMDEQNVRRMLAQIELAVMTGRVEDLRAGPRRTEQRINQIAVIPVTGIIENRGGFLGGFFSSTDAIGAAVDAAAADPDLRAIVLDVDSPGGSVYGVPELADRIYAARSRKRIVAVANNLMASAAYFIGSAAHEVVATPSSETGSIGVFAVHVDMSGMLEQAGWKVTVVKAGKFKAEGHPFGPLPEEAHAFLQSRVDDYYDMFRGAVARHRSSTPAQVRDGFGQGRAVGAKDAVESGLADRIDTLHGTIERLGARHNAGPRRAILERRLALVQRELDGQGGTS